MDHIEGLDSMCWTRINVLVVGNMATGYAIVLSENCLSGELRPAHLPPDT